MKQMLFWTLTAKGLFLLMAGALSVLGQSDKAFVLSACIPVLWVLTLGKIASDRRSGVKTSAGVGNQNAPLSNISEAEFHRGAMNIQTVLLSDLAKLVSGGHLQGKANPDRDFGGRPFWLRYEHDGFYLNYPHPRASWKIDPVPSGVLSGTCDENGSVQLKSAASTWVYNGHAQAKSFEVAAPPSRLPFLAKMSPIRKSMSQRNLMSIGSSRAETLSCGTWRHKLPLHTLVIPKTSCLGSLTTRNGSRDGCLDIPKELGSAPTNDPGGGGAR